jgi:hypothetical protein
MKFQFLKCKTTVPLIADCTETITDISSQKTNSQKWKRVWSVYCCASMNAGELAVQNLISSLSIAETALI